VEWPRKGHAKLVEAAAPRISTGTWGRRFKSRVHVFPPQIPGEYKGISNTKLEAGGDK
jgi:hypothetical protein